MNDRRRKQSKTFTPIGTLIQGIMRQYHPLPEHELAQVWEIWENAVGSMLAANARPAAFKGNLLLVHVTNSTWMHQLRFIENELIEKLNQSLGGDRVAKIKFKIGPV